MPTFSDDKGKDMDPMGDLLGEFMERNKLNLRYAHTDSSYDQEMLTEDMVDDDTELTMDVIRQILGDDEADFTLTLEDEDGESTDFSLAGLLETEDKAYLLLFAEEEEEDEISVIFARCDEQEDGTIELDVLDEGEELDEVREMFEELQNGDEAVPTITFVDEEGNEETVDLMNVLETEDGRQYGVLMYTDQDGTPEIRFVHYREDENGSPEIAEIEDEEEYEMVDRLYEEQVRSDEEEE